MADFQPGEFALPPTTPGTSGARGVDGQVLAAPSRPAAEAAAASSLEDDVTTEQDKSYNSYKNTARYSFASPKVNASTSNALRYPKKDPIQSYSDYVTFNFYKYNPPWGRNVGSSISNDPASNVGVGSSLGTAKDYYDKYNRSGQEGLTDPTLGPIVMYMPEDIQSEFGADWNKIGVGNAARFLLGGVGNQGDAIKNLADVAGNISTLAGTAKAAGYSALTSAINQFLGGGGISVNQVMGGISGTVINPNVEMMYEAPRLRAFNLSFKMSPRDGDEAKEIQKICNRFKKSMLPRFGGGVRFEGLKAGNLITIPDLCQVTFMSGGDRHPVLPQFKLCAITNVSVNYTPDGSYAVFGDSQPVSTQLTISFQETKIIFGDEINETGPSF